MFGNVFFRDFPYKLVTHARVFSLSFVDTNINPKAALFISVNMQFLNKIFSYSNMASWQKIKKLGLAIFVPFKNEKIDFEYMEKFINILEEERLQILETYLQVNSLDNCQLTDAEQLALDKITNKEIKFRQIKIEELFNITTGRDFIIGKTKPGSMPLVSHTNTNNGIVGYVDPVIDRRIFKANKTIALADRGVFFATTQLFDFYIGTRVKALIFKNGEKTEAQRLFTTTSINKLQVFFTEYLSNATDKLPKLIICLPVTDDNEIDYDFMETYIKAIEKKVIQKVITWKDSEMKTLKIVS